jgi:hypothetical protein
MAVYKVIQDVEAEDKLLGPLTFKGLIYAGIAVLCGFINVRLMLSTAPLLIKLIIIFSLAWPMLLFGLLASPIGRDQPTEVWLLSRLRYFLKPHLRIWDQSGIIELVTVTAPKKITHQLTKGLTQTEVNSRLQALAATLDSRGWAVKNVNVNLNNLPSYASEQTDRLIEVDNVAREVPTVNVRAADDILDANANPTAQKFKAMIDESEQRRKQILAERLNVHKSEQMRREEEFESRHGAHAESIHDIRPVFERHRPAAKHQAKTEVTPPTQAAKLELAQSGNDLSVASIASLANRNSGEVTINLH